jgi:biofilm protein TabA
MNKTVFKIIFTLTAIALLSLHTSAQTKKQTVVLNNAFNNKAMLNGTEIVPDTSIDVITFAAEYKANKALWKKAFDYLTTTNLDTLSPGKYLIAGDSLYAIVVKGPTKTPDMVKWESHKTHIDIQCVVTGAETMQLAKPGTIIPTVVYDPKTDNANYTATAGKSYIAKPGHILLFFPGIVHRAGLKADGFETDKRVILKIMASGR